MVRHTAMSNVASRRAKRRRVMVLRIVAVLLGLVVAAFCALNPWLSFGLIPVAIVLVLAFRGRRRRIQLTRPRTAQPFVTVEESLHSGLTRIAVFFAIAFLLWVIVGPGPSKTVLSALSDDVTASGIGPTRTRTALPPPLKLPTVYEAKLRFNRGQREWNIERKLKITLDSQSQMTRDKLMVALWEEEWFLDDRTYESDDLTFLKWEQRSEKIDQRARESSQDFYFEAPFLSGFKLMVKSPPKVTLITPKNMVAATIPQADPVDLHRDKEEQRSLDLGKNEGVLLTDQLRVAAYHPLLRSPSGAKLAGWSTGPIAWSSLLALIGILMWVFKEDIFHPWIKKLLGLRDESPAPEADKPVTAKGL
jgi:hypothetical protein